jgi:anti-sigma factor RsiW
MNTQRMSCTEAREKLPLYVGGDLDREVLENLRSHLERCAECHAKVQEAVAARRELVLAFRERSQGLKPDLWSGIRAKLVAEGRILEDAEGRPARSEARRGTVRPLRAGWSQVLAPLAAAALVLFVVQLSGVFSERSLGEKPVRPGPQLHDAGSLVVAPTLPPSGGGLIQVEASEAVTMPAAFRAPRDGRVAPRADGAVSLTSFETDTSEYK